ncbi:DUF3157 family protein [Photobacterium damselae subsp. piscicida]|uniref:DUF3157 family protein n=1 Tax=Photobacterium damsela subsp. piscicida TaxID=38294 RepID=A0A1V1VFJ1_PHODP|nr:DUF3157 family protein [Photobacterium damselae]MBE8126719.1 DUF3157 family protein [Photobacterium damselae subsp. piscicida]MDP2513757.1 DUF3157 family protein [Photobacterium damselae subsp. piscicida]MDP2534045.1 DUF3157 family protein [Photobacterium damselae subsp. piscicida]MDP2544330.1 DUF3157 family protein [Photobacterium damselae subsp. piscicida]MDP2557036.1 DUF3157 family protein [Photobacterium damselae subsp. piscicida]
MHLKYRLISAAVLGLLSANVAAQQVVELKDGRRVQLNDDFTWQYVQKQQTTTAKPEVLAASAQLAPVTAVPFTNTVVGTQFKLNSSKPILQLSQSGIDAILQPAYYQVVTPIDLLMVKFTFYKRSNNLIVHLFAFRKTNGFSY